MFRAENLPGVTRQREGASPRASPALKIPEVFNIGKNDYPSRISNKQALRTTFVGDPRKFTNYERVKDKGPMTRKRDLIKQTVRSQFRS